MPNWLNNDGLYIPFGVNEATPAQGGEYRTAGALRCTEVRIDLTTLNTSTATIVEDTSYFPKNAVVESVELEVEVAATGSSSTLTIGLIASDRSTAVDATAFANAVALATLTPAGARNVLVGGGTGAGTKIGVKTTADGLITAKAGTAVFTAGVIRVRIFWRGA